MRYVIWVLRLVVFLMVLMFALKNTNPVVINFYDAYLLQDVPLIVVMLVTFVLGATFGLLLIVPTLLRRRREAVRLRRELDCVQRVAKQQAICPAPQSLEGIVPVSSL